MALLAGSKDLTFENFSQLRGEYRSADLLIYEADLLESKTSRPALEPMHEEAERSSRRLPRNVARLAPSCSEMLGMTKAPALVRKYAKCHSLSHRDFVCVKLCMIYISTYCIDTGHQCLNTLLGYAGSP